MTHIYHGGFPLRQATPPCLRLAATVDAVVALYALPSCRSRCPLLLVKYGRRLPC